MRAAGSLRQLDPRDHRRAASAFIRLRLGEVSALPASDGKMGMIAAFKDFGLRYNPLMVSVIRRARSSRITGG